MEEYIKLFTAPEDGDGFLIEDIPWICSVESTRQNLVCDNYNCAAINNNDLLEIINLEEKCLLKLSDGSSVIIQGATITRNMLSPYASNVTSAVIGNGVTEIGDDAFNDCDNMKYVKIPHSVTTIGLRAFQCKSLVSLTIPNSLTSVGLFAFTGLSKLTELTIEDGLTKISQLMFQASILTTITIPKSVTRLENSCFYNCNKVSSFNYEGTKSEWARIQKDSQWRGSEAWKTSVVHCTDGDVSM